MKGIVLVNLGTPDKPEKREVKAYLKEFLMDKNVIDIPYLYRAFLVKGIILNTRPEKSAEAYQKIWTDRGSPLLFHSEDLVARIKRMVKNPVGLAMRYNQPSIHSTIKEMIAKGCTELVFLPLYPQYAMSSTLTVMQKVAKEMKKIDASIPYSFIPPFYKDKDYLNLLAKSVQNQMKERNFDYVLFSYHGLPIRQIEKTDPTRSHCFKSGNCCEVKSVAHDFCYRHQSLNITKEIVKRLDIEEGKYGSTFQSRMGRTEWVKPYTDHALEDLPKKGVKSLLVVTPSFVADCLETVEEIGIAGKASFIENGGEYYKRVDCFNSDKEWAELVSKWIVKL